VATVDRGRRVVVEQSRPTRARPILVRAGSWGRPQAAEKGHHPLFCQRAVALRPLKMTAYTNRPPPTPGFGRGRRHRRRRRALRGLQVGG